MAVFIGHLALGPGSCLAGSRSAQSLEMGVDGRGVAMAGAQTAAVNGVTALYWNPAVLGRLLYQEAAFMHNNVLQAVDHDVLYYAQPVGGYGVFGGGLSLLRAGKIDGYDAFGVPTETLTASDALMTLGWGRSWENFPVLPGLHTGLNLKYLEKKLGNDGASSMLADVGFFRVAPRGFFRDVRTGLVVQNLGTSLTFLSESASPPMTVKLGFARPFFQENLTLAADVAQPSGRDVYVSLGLDYRLWNIMAFRLGYTSQSDLAGDLAYGVSFGNERLHLDYSFVPFGTLGDNHRISFGFRFGGAYRREQVQSQIHRAYEKAEARYAQGALMDAYIQASVITDVAPWHRPSRTLMRRIQRDFEEVRDIYKKEQMQVQVSDHFARGESYFQVDNLISARREFKAIAAVQPNHIGARTYLVRIEERFGGVVQGFYETGMRYFAAGDYKKAKEYFEKILLEDPNNFEAREQLTRTEKLLSDTKKASQDRAKLESLRPVYHAALSSFEKQNYEEALRKFEEMLQLDPDNTEAKRYQLLCRELLAKEAFDQGNIAAREGDWPRASAGFRRALEFKPDMPEAQEALNRVRSQLGEQNKAESQRLYKMGLETFLAGNAEKAKEMWQKAVELDPENLDAKRGLERLGENR